MWTPRLLAVLCLAVVCSGAAAGDLKVPGMVRVSPGTFVMGSDAVLLGEKPTAHRVTITTAFHIGVTEVTVAQYRRFDPSKPGDPRHPVVQITWHQAREYIDWLNANRLPRAPYRYRMCTEAEWEYAARGGSTTIWSCGDDADCLTEIAWFRDTTWDLKPVKTKQPNGLGLYDMFGNAAEWVADYHADYDPDPQLNPTGPPDGARRVRRGGAYHSPPKHLRAASRGSAQEGHASRGLGLRLCASAERGIWTRRGGVVPWRFA